MKHGITKVLLVKVSSLSHCLCLKGGVIFPKIHRRSQRKIEALLLEKLKNVIIFFVLKAYISCFNASMLPSLYQVNYKLSGLWDYKT